MEREIEKMVAKRARKSLQEEGNREEGQREEEDEMRMKVIDTNVSVRNPGMTIFHISKNGRRESISLDDYLRKLEKRKKRMSSAREEREMNERAREADRHEYRQSEDDGDVEGERNDGEDDEGENEEGGEEEEGTRRQEIVTADIADGEDEGESEEEDEEGVDDARSRRRSQPLPSTFPFHSPLYNTSGKRKRGMSMSASARRKKKKDKEKGRKRPREEREEKVHEDETPAKRSKRRLAGKRKKKLTKL